MIELSEFVAQLRRELYQAILAAGDEPLRLEVDAIELELSVTAGSDRRTDGRVKLWVVGEAGFVAAAQSQQAHRLKLNLKPVFSELRSTTPWVSDRELPGEH